MYEGVKWGYHIKIPQSDYQANSGHFNIIQAIRKSIKIILTIT